MLLRERVLLWMKRTLWMAVLLTMACAGGKVEDFSATQVTIRADGREASRHAIYVTSDKVRLEADAPTQKAKLIVILSKDKGTQWIINPTTKTYFERYFPATEWDLTLRRDRKAERADLGTEEVSGFACSKREVETATGVMGRATTSKTTVWVCDRICMPLRTKEDHGQVVELRDIVPGRQDPRLFEVPGDCAKVDNIVKVLGGESRRGPEGGVTGIGERAGQ